MPLARVVNYLIIAAALYLGWVYVVPWFRELGAPSTVRRGEASGSGEDARCVDGARQAAEVFSEEMRSFSRPPIDREAWDRASLRIENRIDHARDLCSCSRPACTTAQGALGELADLAGDFSAAARGDRAPPVNAASQLRRVHDILDTAARESRSEDWEDAY